MRWRGRRTESQERKRIIRRLSRRASIVVPSAEGFQVSRESREEAARAYARSHRQDPPLEIPRCEHGHILLGCPHDDCPQQNAYLDEIRSAMKHYEDRLWDLRRPQ